MRNMSKKHIKLQRYYICNSNSKLIITHQLICRAVRQNMTVKELQFLVNDKWKLLIY